MTHEFTKGTLAIDVVQCSLVKVVRDSVGRVEDQAPEMRDMIKYADGNQQVGYTQKTPCVEIQYVTGEEPKRSYTMPITRLATSERLVREFRQLLANAEMIEQVRPTILPDGDKSSSLGDFAVDE